MGIAKVYNVHIAVAMKPENYCKEISWDFPFKGREAVKQKGLHRGWEGVHIAVGGKPGEVRGRE
jgi:hypothetical protein